MANEITPVEGNKGFIDSATDFLGSAFGEVKETAADVWSFVTDTATNIYEGAKWVVEDIGTGKIDISKPDFLLSPLFSNVERAKIQPTYQASQEDRDMGKKIEGVSGWQMAKDMFKLGWKAVKELVTGSELSKNLIEGVKEEDFNKNLSIIRDDLDQKNKTINDIVSSDPKYKTYRDFNDRIYKEYLKARGISSVENSEDFKVYQQAELAKLNPTDQQAIVNQWSELGLKTADLQKSAKEQEQKMREFINQNVKPTGDKTGEQIFQDIQKQDEDFMKESKYLGLTQEIRQKSADEINKALEKDAKLLIGISPQLEELREAAIDNRTAANQFYYSVLGMDYLPDNEKLALKYKEGAQSCRVIKPYGISWWDVSYRRSSTIMGR